MSLFGSIKRLPKGMAIALIHVYQKGLSPLLPDSCIYFPSCSQYAIEAIE